MAFEKVEVGLWTYEKPGDEIVGNLLKVESEVGPNKSMMYTLVVEGKPINVWGATVLDAKMSVVSIGDTVKIVYTGLGEKQGGKNAPKKFDVFVDRD